jgi:enoyl-CoA hydratase/carnithine racemase
VTTLRTETRNGVRHLILCRAAEYNTITPALRDELAAAIDAADDDRDVRVLLLRAEGPAFCAGYGLDWSTRSPRSARKRAKRARREPRERSRSGPQASEVHQDAGAQATSRRVWDSVADHGMMSRFVATYMKLWYARKPTIAAVQGWCIGGGTDMVLCADLIVAADDAVFGYPPARVWGTPTTAMWVYRMGLEQAKRYLLTGDEIPARKAAEIGLILETVPPDRSSSPRHRARRAHGAPADEPARDDEAALQPDGREHGLRSPVAPSERSSTASPATPRKASTSCAARRRSASARRCASGTTRSRTTGAAGNADGPPPASPLLVTTPPKRPDSLGEPVEPEAVMTTREAVARGLLGGLLLLGPAARAPAQEISYSWTLGSGETQDSGFGQVPMGPAAVRVDESLGGSRVRIMVDPGPVVRILTEAAWEEGSHGAAGATVTIYDDVVLAFRDLLGNPIVDIPFLRFSFDADGTLFQSEGDASFLSEATFQAAPWGVGGNLQYPAITRRVSGSDTSGEGRTGDALNQTYHSEVLGPGYTARFLPLPASVFWTMNVGAGVPVGGPMPRPAGSARADLSQTLGWGGLTPIDEAGTPVGGVVIEALSAGGTDWALPAPEPAGGALGLAAAAALAGLRARRGQPRAAAR